MQRKMSESQKAYETKRAQKAGMSLDKWLQSKERERLEATAQRKPPPPPKPPKPPGLLRRLVDRAHKPLKKT
jgi:hypothetical protein